MLKVFISYSWDGNIHQDWVKKLADDLEVYEEFHIVFDQYDLDTQLDKNYFMEKGIFDSDIILIVCTELYAKKANNREGGVGIETFMTTIKHWEESEKHGASNIIALTREDRKKSIPNYLKGKISIDFSDDSKYLKNLEVLKSDLSEIASPNSKRPQKAKTLKTEKSKFFEFDRVDDILAINYKNRKKINNAKDFSGKNKIKYEYWEIQPLEKSYILVLFENIHIKQTVERFIQNNKVIPKKMTLLRVMKGDEGYVAKIFSDNGYSVNITEYTIDSFVWNFCIDQEWKNENKVKEEKFFIDQRIYKISETGEEKNLDLSIDYIVSPEKPKHLPNIGTLEAI